MLQLSKLLSVLAFRWRPLVSVWRVARRAYVKCERVETALSQWREELDRRIHTLVALRDDWTDVLVVAAFRAVIARCVTGRPLRRRRYRRTLAGR